MSDGLFRRIEQELAARDQAAGLSMTDLLELPDALRELASWMLRNDIVSLNQAMAQLEQDETTTRSLLDALVAKGFVREIATRDDTRYKLRISSRPHRAVPPNLWQALDTKLGDETEE